MRRLAALALVLAIAAPAGAAVPLAAEQYRLRFLSACYEVFGPLGDCATPAGLITQESGWNPNAVSRVGAKGLGQMMDPTGRQLGLQYPKLLGSVSPFEVRWALYASMTLLRDNIAFRRRVEKRSACSAVLMGLSDYNGGPFALNHEIDLCGRAPRCDQLRWYDNVALQRWRRPDAFAENRDYVDKVIRWAAVFAAAGWGRGTRACSTL